MNLKNSLKIFFIAGIILLAFFSFNLSAFANGESIESFDIKATIEKDGGAVQIEETIKYNFSANEKHGIYRNIPLTSKDGPSLVINVAGVSDEKYQQYKFSASVSDNVLKIKIGDPDVLVSGVKTYVINYKVNNAIRTFADHDEFYWNATGNEWAVPIKNSSTRVILPESDIKDLKMECFTGAQGSKEKNCKFESDTLSAKYFLTKELNSNEGMTIVLGMPLGHVNNTYVESSSSILSPGEEKIAVGVIFGILSFIIFFIVIIFSRQKKLAKPHPIIPKELKGKPVVVEYNPPEGITPIEMGTLLDRRVDITDISSVIMDLAQRGYLKIRYTVKQIRFWPDKKDFELIKLKDGADLTHPADKIMFKLLFDGRDSVTLSDLKEKETVFQTTITDIKKDTEEHLHNENYFDKGFQQKAKKKVEKLTLPLAIVYIVVFFATIISSGAVLIPFIIFAVLSAITVSLGKNKLTPLGIEALRKIIGFREFLEMTEKEKLRLLNAPSLQPETFEKFLPYAMVLGVEEQWAKKFEGIYNTVPNWYEDSTTPVFNSITLTHAFGSFDSSFKRVFAVTSPTSSSSGFGGGGFSGGGSGGGGGGSW